MYWVSKWKCIHLLWSCMWYILWTVFCMCHVCACIPLPPHHDLYAYIILTCSIGKGCITHCGSLECEINIIQQYKCLEIEKAVILKGDEMLIHRHMKTVSLALCGCLSPWFMWQEEAEVSYFKNVMLRLVYRYKGGEINISPSLDMPLRKL